jgi:hypothetical protein
MGFNDNNGCFQALGVQLGVFASQQGRREPLPERLSDLAASGWRRLLALSLVTQLIRHMDANMKMLVQNHVPNY